MRIYRLITAFPHIYGNLECLLEEEKKEKHVNTCILFPDILIAINWSVFTRRPLWVEQWNPEASLTVRYGRYAWPARPAAQSAPPGEVYHRQIG